MRIIRATGGLWALLVISLFNQGSVWAQTNAEVNAGIQFNFSTPGARSLGFGGAFLALADDATAAFTNPAGMTVLTRPELSVEGRRWDFTSEFTDFGHAFGDPTGNGVDTVAGLRTGDSSSNTTGMSFLSFVYPKNRFAAAFYRHELSNFEANFRTQGAFFDADAASLFRFFPIDARMDLKLVNYGLSGAYQISDNFSVGLGISYYDFDMDSVTQRFFVDQNDFFGAPNYSPDNVINSQFQQGSDNDLAVNFGFLWKQGPHLSVGGVYREGPEFDFEARNIAGPAASSPGEVFAAQTARFRVPTVFGLGLAIHPTDETVITFDYDHVDYSKLSEGTISIFFEPDDPAFNDARRAALQRLEVDAANEVHLGFEYFFAKLKYPIALRAGTWWDPDHKIRFTGQPDSSLEQRELAIPFRAGTDEFHYAVGLGIVFEQRFQIDAGADFSDLVDTASLSAVYRF